jgi:hypothetical protein
MLLRRENSPRRHAAPASAISDSPVLVRPDPDTRAAARRGVSYVRCEIVVNTHLEENI